MRRVHLKKKRKLNLITYILILITSLIIMVSLVFNYIGKNITPKILNYAELQSRKVTSLVLSQSITDEVISLFESENVFVTNKDSNGTVSSIDFDSAVVNKALATIAKSVKTYLRMLENGQVEELGISMADLFETDQSKLRSGVIFEIPSGIIFDNGLLANVGPKIPVKLSFLGNVTADVITDIKDYGINNAIVQISIKIVVTEKVVLPYDSSQIEVEAIIPVAIKLIQGNVPNYYFNGIEAPSLSIDTN